MACTVLPNYRLRLHAEWHMSRLHGFETRHDLMSQFMADKMPEFMSYDGKGVM